MTTTDDPHTNFRHLTAGLETMPQWQSHWQSKGSVDLITDVGDISNQFDQSPFDQLRSLHDQEYAETERPAEDIVDTQLGQMVAAAIERDAQDDPWSILWLHSGFLTRCWDAPRYLALIDETEEDQLAPSEEVELLHEASEVTEQLENLPLVFQETTPPKIELVDDTHPDLITSWMRTYGCQVRLVDVLLEILLTSLKVEDPYVLILGTSGFQLGQNGWIGHRQGPLRSADIRLPMIVSDVGPLHLPQLTRDSILPRVLDDLAQHGEENPNVSLLWSPEQWCQPDCEKEIATESNRSLRAVTTPEWFFVQNTDATEHLYLKPDDIDDFNNVSRLRPDVIERFNQTKKNLADGKINEVE